MNFGNNGKGEGWVWQGQNCTHEDNTSTAEISKSLMMPLNKRRDNFDCPFDDTTTPLKACGDLSYHVASNEVGGKEIEQYREPCSQLKRRRVLDFESDFLDSSLCANDMYLRSEEIPDTFEDDMSKISEWVAGFAEDTNVSNGEHLDPSYDGWIEDCFSDDKMQLSNVEMIASGPSDAQNDVTELQRNSIIYNSNAGEKLPVHTSQNIKLKGKKSYMRTPPKLASSIIYPFTFIKPCGAHGDMTLKDINQRLHTPKPNKTEQDSSLSYPTSAISGKPVVGKTKIRTEGGEGSITIVRTKG